MMLTAVRDLESGRPTVDKQIDKDRALRMLEQAVVRRGAVYITEDLRKCRYAKYRPEFDEVRDGERAAEFAVGASCIVGEAFLGIGFDIPALARMDVMVGPFSGPQFEQAFPGWIISRGAADVFRQAQIAQDKGHPWGFAYQQGLRAALSGF